MSARVAGSHILFPVHQDVDGRDKPGYHDRKGPCQRPLA